MNADISHIQRMCGGNGTFSHNRCNYRNSRGLGKITHFFLCPADNHSSAKQEKRSFGLLQCLHCPPDLARMCAGHLSAASYLHIFRVTAAAVFFLYIFGQIHHHHTRPAGFCNHKRLLYYVAQFFPFSHRNRIFAYTSGDSHNIHLLKGVIPNQAGGHLSRKTDKRDTVKIGGCDPRHQIGSPRAACYQAYSHSACRTGISVRGMNQSLFMPRQDNINFFFPIKSVKQINRLSSGICKESIYPFRLKCLYKQFCSCYHPVAPPYSLYKCKYLHALNVFFGYCKGSTRFFIPICSSIHKRNLY